MHHETQIPTDVTIPSTSLWAKLPLLGLAMGIVGLGATVVVAASDSSRAMFAYLFAFLVVLSIALGALAFVLIQHVVRAGWSTTVRRIGETAMITLPVFLLLFLPIATIGQHTLYPWTDPAHLDDVLSKKAPYLNTGFWMLRAVFYFVCWSALSWILYSRSVAQDDAKTFDDRARITRSLWKVSAAGIFIYGLTQTFAAFDWLMSLQPHWYSTIFGVYYFAGSIVAFYSFLALVCIGLQRGGLIKNAVTTEHYHDIGKFMFGHTIFWAYIAFSQFFLIWYANIPEEIEFFLKRLEGGWGVVSYAIPLIHFFIPFLFLLSRHIKRSKPTLAFGAVWLLVVHCIDLYWLVMPNFTGGHEHEPHLAPHLVDFAALLGVAGVFLAVFGFFLRKNKVVAVGDPRLEESLRHENY